MPEQFRPQQFMEVARDLAAEPTDEPKLRAAVGRAYCAAFLMIRSKAQVIGKDSLHERAKIAVSTRSLAAGGTLQTLRELRVHADYILGAGDPSYDPYYGDWADNWKNAEWCYDSLLQFISQWT